MDNLGGWVQSKPNVAKIRQENWHRTALCLINVCSLRVRVLNSYQASLNHLGAAVIRASWQLILPCGKRDVSRLPTDGTHPSPKQRLDRIKWSAKSGLVINSKSLFDNKRTKKTTKFWLFKKCWQAYCPLRVAICLNEQSKHYGGITVWDERWWSRRSFQPGQTYNLFWGDSFGSLVSWLASPQSKSTFYPLVNTPTMACIRRAVSGTF